jgi:NAD(P)-dependent dehydrogenase (short-subunit alcohol dehydrogenase family)
MVCANGVFSQRSIKRLQTPEDLMGTLVFLCSSDSDLLPGRRSWWMGVAFFIEDVITENVINGRVVLRI